MSGSAPRRWLTAVAAAVVAGGLALVAAPAAAGTASFGFVRLAHLSPDTPAVDVYLSSPTGAVKNQVFKAVAYGVVSPYLTLPVGVYEVAMRVANAPASSKPVLTTSVTVTARQAYTVAGVGRHAQLGLSIIKDDLTLPTADKAKVRVVQASVRAPVLAVSVADGPTIADDVAFATTTPYREVDPGRWRLIVRPVESGPQTQLTTSLGAGNVYSVLVLDNKASGLTAKVLTDASRRGGLPSGGVETGAGGTQPAPRGSALPLGVALALFGVGLGVAVLRRRPAGRHVRM
ncbi:MAG TPA: DUF4397 domain-containing protein [Micromonosporaceae bacterium]|jgi:hypothetical protein